jgi:EAL domain-containing protein (putative c-di-GMP-specific phosphodiesterase class I)
VLDTACRQLAAWRAARLVRDDFGVAVNVSGVQLRRADLVAHVHQALDDSGLPPERLTLEVTETAVVDLEAVRPRLEELRAISVRIAIDDFGTGQSSLSYLKDLPADVVKLPRPFVVDSVDHGRGAAIVQGLVGLARPLGLGVLAEGVETDAQRACVVAAGCDAIQGFLYAPPLAPAEFAARARSAAEPVAHATVPSPSR